MKKSLKLLTLLLLIISYLSHSSLYAFIEIAAAPSSYAVSWKAFDNQDQEIARGTFQPDDLSVSTGYKYAMVPNDVDKIIITSQGYRFDNGPVLDFEVQTAIEDPSDDSKYKLEKIEDQIVANLIS